MSVLQVAQRREHQDCVLVLNQQQPAGQPAEKRGSTLQSCTASNQGTATASPAHPENQEIYDYAVQDIRSGACASEGHVGEGWHAAGARKAATEEPNSGGPPMGLPCHGTTASEGRSCEEGSCDTAACAAQVFKDADWGRVVSKEQGKAWMQAAKAGDTPMLEQLLKSNVALLAYRGQGTTFGFGGVSYSSA